mmetsp:Transcript_3310/g.6736  ORF Transcript_3310/g.6736 Transcript_3310/m.6736 type:complete len:263 (+) Transcript_3310:3-791(+)
MLEEVVKLIDNLRPIVEVPQSGSLVSTITFAVLYVVKKKIGSPLNVYWYAVLHAVLTGPPALLCVYLDMFAPKISPGSDHEPLRSIKGEKALSPLHSILPMISLGYGYVDVIEGFNLERWDFMLHGFAMVASMGSCCWLGKSHLVTPALLMELSSIPLNFLDCTIENKFFTMGVQLTFVISFFFTRLIIVPWLWFRWITTYYQHVFVGGNKSDFPRWFVCVVIGVGLIFHCLNAYWFVYMIVGKAIDAIYEISGEGIGKEEL